MNSCSESGHSVQQLGSTVVYKFRQFLGYFWDAVLCHAQSGKGESQQHFGRKSLSSRCAWAWDDGLSIMSSRYIGARQSDVDWRKRIEGTGDTSCRLWMNLLEGSMHLHFQLVFTRGSASDCKLLRSLWATCLLFIVSSSTSWCRAMA